MYKKKILPLGGGVLLFVHGLDQPGPREPGFPSLGPLNVSGGDQIGKPCRVFGWPDTDICEMMAVASLHGTFIRW